MKKCSWRLVGAVALIVSLAALLAFTVHLMRSTSSANREIRHLRGEVARQQAESKARESELVAPVAARVNDLSESVKEQSDALAELDELGARVSKLEAEAQPTALPTAQPTAQPEVQPTVQPVAPSPVVPATSSGPTEPEPLAPAAPAEQVDEGRFLVLQMGVPIGVETFDLRRSGEGYVLTSTVLRSEGIHGTELAQTVTLTAGWRPTGYRLTGAVDGAAHDVTVDIQEGRVTLDIGVSRALEQEVQTQPAVVTFDWATPSTLATLHRVVGGAADEAPLELTAVRADREELTSMQVEPRTLVTVSTPGTKDLGYAHQVRLGTDADAATYYVHDGTVIAVAVPSRGLFAYRQDLFPDGVSVVARTLVEIAAPLGVGEAKTQIANRGVTLKATFTAPAPPSEKMPAVLLLPDLGPFDRNGDAVGLETKILRDLALRLGQQGIASLRLDPRGVGESGGEYSGLTLDDLETDALVALITLRANPRTDASQVFIVGYGYGGLVAQRLGARASAAGVICIGMPARSLADNEIELVRRRAEEDGLSSEDVQTLVERERAYWEFVRSTQGAWTDVGLAAAQAALPWMSEADYAKRSQFFPLPLLRDVLDKNPVDAVRSLQKKMLIIQGDKDFVVPTTDAGLLVQAAQDAGNQSATMEVLAGVNHWLRAQTEPAASLNAHLDDETAWPVVGAILDLITPSLITPGGRGGPTPAS